MFIQSYAVLTQLLVVLEFMTFCVWNYVHCRL